MSLVLFIGARISHTHDATWYHDQGVDEHGVVTCNGFDDVLRYYSEMSALGDIPFKSPASVGQITSISIPLCILHALDDPLITCKTVTANEGLRHPSNVVNAGCGNVLKLLTKAGNKTRQLASWSQSSCREKGMDERRCSRVCRSVRGIQRGMNAIHGGIPNFRGV